MKRPYLNQEQRQLIILDTFKGSLFLLDIAIKKHDRQVYKEEGYFAMIKKRGLVFKLINLKLLGRYV